MSRFARFLAVDWSGAKGARQKGIALAIALATVLYLLARDMGVDLMHEQMNLLGFGRPTGIDLLGEARGALGRPDDLLDVGALGGIPDLRGEEVGIPEHRREQVVEVMGDPGGHGTDGLHFLGLQELHFQ